MPFKIVRLLYTELDVNHYTCCRSLRQKLCWLLISSAWVWQVKSGFFVGRPRFSRHHITGNWCRPNQADGGQFVAKSDWKADSNASNKSLLAFRCCGNSSSSAVLLFVLHSKRIGAHSKVEIIRIRPNALSFIQRIQHIHVCLRKLKVENPSVLGDAGGVAGFGNRDHFMLQIPA